MPSHIGRDRARAVLSGRGWLSMSQPPTVSRPCRQPGEGWQEHLSCREGGRFPSLYVHSSQHKVVLVDLHSSCRAAFNATGLLWAEAPS